MMNLNLPLMLTGYLIVLLVQMGIRERASLQNGILFLSVELKTSIEHIDQSPRHRCSAPLRLLRRELCAAVARGAFGSRFFRG